MLGESVEKPISSFGKRKRSPEDMVSNGLQLDYGESKQE